VKRLLSPKVLLALLVVAGLIFASSKIPIARYIEKPAEWIRDAGALGVVVYGLAYVLLTVLLIPGSVVTLLAGYAYGVVKGTMIVSPASVAAATAAFVLGRTVARRWVAARVEKNPRFAAIDRAVGRSGFKIVALLRLSPVFPFTLLNYALGLTRVRLRDYVLASFLGMLPGTVMYVYLGSLVTSAAALAGGSREKTPAEFALYGLGLLATIGVTVYVTRLARRALRDAVDLPAAPGPSGIAEVKTS